MSSDAPDPIEPGSPSLEDAAFVVLGAIGSIAVIVHLVGVFG